jgi:GntR family transcriptional regulator / MocR family aminotransferase
VAPEAMVRRCREALQLLDGGRPGLEQAVVAGFITDGHFARHLKRMRAAYRARRDALAAAITQASGARLEVAPTIGGLHLVARVREGDDVELTRRAARAGLYPAAMSRMSVRPGACNALVLGFTGVAEDQATAIAGRLEAALAAGQADGCA